MKIPEYFARERMETSRLPRAPAGIADVGAGLEAEAMAGFGEVLNTVIQKWYEREGNTQFDTQRRLVREEINKFELTGFATTDEHDAAYKKLKTAIKKLTPKNRMGAKKFQSWRDYISPVMDRSAAEKKIRQIHQNNQVEYFKNISGIITEKDFDKAKAEAKLLTQGAVDDGTRTPTQAASDYQRIMADWGEAQKQALLETVAEAARTMPLKDALYYINVIPRTDITETERNGLIAQRKRQEEIAMAEFTTSVPEIKAKVLDQIRDPKSGITEEDISNLIGKGLNVNDGDLLIGRLDVFKSFWFKRADMYLKQNLGWSDTFTKFEHPEGALSYSLAMEELFGVIETEKLKDKDLYDRARAIATPYLMEYWEKALFLSAEKLARLKRMLEIKSPTAKPPPETTVKPEPIKKGIDLDPDGIWQ